MRILVNISAAAVENNRGARLREGMRMSCLAWGFFRLGHDVDLVGNTAHPFKEDKRYKDRATLGRITRDGAKGEYDLAIIGERHGPKPLKKFCGRILMFKTCNKLDWKHYDKPRLGMVDGLIGYAFNDCVLKNKSVLVLPHGVHDVVLSHFYTRGLMPMYLNDELEIIREAYQTEKRNGSGFLGTKSYGRVDMAAACKKIQALRPCDIRWGNKVAADLYLQHLANLKISLCFSGHLPSSYRFSESVLMGANVAMKLWGVPYSEPVDTSNAIVVDDWGNPSVFNDAEGRFREIQAAADASYCLGWSPTGQARQIISRFFGK